MGARGAGVADAAGRDFIMALGMSLYCPYEGVIAPERTLDCVAKLRNLGVRRFYLAASTGMEGTVRAKRLEAGR